MADPQNDAGVYIWGGDLHWRKLDVPNLQPVSDGANETPILRPTSLSADGTQLALPQPDALIVVNLATGEARMYVVPGPSNAYVIWEDETHVYVAEENKRRGSIVDLKTSKTAPSSHTPSTRVLSDGSALTWLPGDRRASQAPSTPVMQWDDGRVVGSPANNSGGYFPSPPLVQRELAVGLHAAWNTTTAIPETTSDPSLDDLLRTTNGVAIVDTETGDVLGYLNLGAHSGAETTLLGWLGDNPVLGLVHPDTEAQNSEDARLTHLVRWDFRGGQLVSLGDVPSPWVSLGPTLPAP